MKAMISQPMRGKTEATIRAERESVIRTLNAKGYQVVDTIYQDFTEKDRPLKYLAKSIEHIAEMDLVYFMVGWESARGCRIERRCCEDYNVPYAEDWVLI